MSFAPSAEIQSISGFIKSTVAKAGANGVVVGLSGGIDSSVVAALSVKALGKKRVLGVYMFEDRNSSSVDAQDASKVAKQLGIETVDFPLTPVIETFQSSFKRARARLSKIPLANVKARSRMTILYALANERRMLVAGTGDKSEILVGYFTKYGDGAADLLPIAHLYKTEVRAIGAALRLPYEIVTKPSSPNLWPGHLASQELPADYDVLDRILVKLFDEKKTPKQVARSTGETLVVIRRVIQMNRTSQHKREPPISLIS